MDILVYSVSVIISMIVVILIGSKFVRPIVVVKDKKHVYTILLVLGIIWGGILDIFISPVLTGVGFGIIAGVIHLMVDYRVN